MAGLSPREIRRLLGLLNDELARKRVSGQVYLVGGAVMCLAHAARASTRDLDGFFKPTKAIREAAARVAAKAGLDPGWLNDGVKGWLSNRDADPDVRALFKTYPSEESPGLRVYTAKPEYLFAMKCRAMRVGGVETNSDIDDIKLLIRAIGLNNSHDAMTLVEKFYPQNMLQPKTRLGLEEIFSNLGLDEGTTSSSSEA